MNPWLIVVIGLAVFVLLWGNPFAADKDDDVTPETGPCNLEDVSFSAKMTKLGAAGTSLSTAANNYYILTDSLGSQVGNAAITVPKEYEMSVMFGENSTGYYTVVKNVNTNCKDPSFAAVQLADAAAPTSVYIKNVDGTVNSGSNKQPIGATSPVTLQMVYLSNAKEYFGHDDARCTENVVIFEFDKTYVQKIEGVGVQGAKYSTDFFSFSNTSIYDGKSAIGVSKTGDGTETSFAFQITPTSSDFSGTEYPIAYLYDCNVDKDEDTLALIWGIEDEDSNMLSLANTSKIVYLS